MKHSWNFVRTRKSCAKINMARGRAVQTPRVEECLHLSFCILVFSNTHSCSISKIYNENFILATDDIIIDKESMHSWPSNLILTTLADNGLITCAKFSYKLPENLGRRHWTERLKSNSVNSTSIHKTFCLMLLLCYWIAKWPSLSFFEAAFFLILFSFHLSTCHC